MPTYIISISPDVVNPERKVRLASAITTIHREETGADSLFARVVFRLVEQSDCFLGARQLSTPHCFIDARIRAGRTLEVRDRLTKRIVDAAVEVLGVPQPAVWLYLTELAPHDMIEYGRTLPTPGDEAEWLESLSDVDRAFIRKAANGSTGSQK